MAATGTLPRSCVSGGRDVPAPAHTDDSGSAGVRAAAGTSAAGATRAVPWRRWQRLGPDARGVRAVPPRRRCCAPTVVHPRMRWWRFRAAQQWGHVRACGGTGAAAVSRTPGLLAWLVRGRGACASSGRWLPELCAGVVPARLQDGGCPICALVFRTAVVRHFGAVS
jgi:hypothetical protein